MITSLVEPHRIRRRAAVRTRNQLPGRGAPISKRLASWARLAVGAVILAALAVGMGPEPFLRAFGAADGSSLAVAFALIALSTVAAAWRWRVVAEALGMTVRLPVAIAAYYRSQFLNATLPGGVLGDVHRGVRHGREVGAIGRSLRAVAWERSLGQAVLLSLTVVVLVLLPFPAQALLTVVAVLAAVAGIVLALLLWVRRPSRGGGVARAISTVAVELRDFVRAPRTVGRLVLISTVVVGGHAAMFLVAARAAGVSAPLDSLLPVALVVLAASAIPANIAGWGPREGAAAWAFAAVGLDASLGVTTAVIYGLMALVATLPGAVVLVLARRPRRAERSRPIGQPATAVAEAGHA